MPSPRNSTIDPEKDMHTKHQMSASMQTNQCRTSKLNSGVAGVGRKLTVKDIHEGRYDRRRDDTEPNAILRDVRGNRMVICRECSVGKTPPDGYEVEEAYVSYKDRRVTGGSRGSASRQPAPTREKV